MKSDSNRLFIALWPTAEIRQKLSSIQEQYALSQYGRCIPAKNLHITLLFLDEVSHTETCRVSNFVRSQKIQPAALKLDQLGSWPRNKVAWVGSSEPAPQLKRLSESLTVGLNRKKLRRQFVPHVTVARKFRRKISHRIEPIDWTIDRILLIKSTLLPSGAVYEVVAESKIE